MIAKPRCWVVSRSTKTATWLSMLIAAALSHACGSRNTVSSECDWREELTPENGFDAECRAASYHLSCRAPDDSIVTCMSESPERCPGWVPGADNPTCRSACEPGEYAVECPQGGPYDLSPGRLCRPFPEPGPVRRACCRCD
jgi:hypothetical protein